MDDDDFDDEFATFDEVPCPHCGYDIPDDVDHCPLCGEQVQFDNPGRSRPLGCSVIGLLGLCAIILEWMTG